MSRKTIWRRSTVSTAICLLITRYVMIMILIWCKEKILCKTLSPKVWRFIRLVSKFLFFHWWRSILLLSLFFNIKFLLNFIFHWCLCLHVCLTIWHKWSSNENITITRVMVVFIFRDVPGQYTRLSLPWQQAVRQPVSTALNSIQMIRSKYHL